MSSAERVRRCCQLQQAEKGRREYVNFLENTPFSSSTTEDEKRLAFQAMEQDEKNRKQRQCHRRYNLKREMKAEQQNYQNEFDLNLSPLTVIASQVINDLDLVSIKLV